MYVYISIFFIPIYTNILIYTPTYFYTYIYKYTYIYIYIHTYIHNYGRCNTVRWNVSFIDMKPTFVRAYTKRS